MENKFSLENKNNLFFGTDCSRKNDSARVIKEKEECVKTLLQEKLPEAIRAAKETNTPLSRFVDEAVNTALFGISPSDEDGWWGESKEYNGRICSFYSNYLDEFCVDLDTEFMPNRALHVLIEGMNDERLNIDVDLNIDLDNSNYDDNGVATLRLWSYGFYVTVCYSDKEGQREIYDYEQRVWAD